jgi:hypothetical protein
VALGFVVAMAAAFVAFADLPFAAAAFAVAFVVAKAAFVVAFVKNIASP